MPNIFRTRGRGRQTRTGVAPFLKSLWEILQSEDSSIIRWVSDGLAFEITCTDKLAEEILPKYFRHTKFASFQRQLNYFGFRKWSKNKTNYCTYSREHFTKHDDSQLHLIRRKTSTALSDGEVSAPPPPTLLPIIEAAKRKRAAAAAAAVVVKRPAKRIRIDTMKSPRKPEGLLMYSGSTISPSFKTRKEELLEPLSCYTFDDSLSWTSDFTSAESKDGGEFVEDHDWIDDLDYLTKSSPKGATIMCSRNPASLLPLNEAELFLLEDDIAHPSESIMNWSTPQHRLVL